MSSGDSSKFRHEADLPDAATTSQSEAPLHKQRTPKARRGFQSSYRFLEVGTDRCIAFTASCVMFYIAGCINFRNAIKGHRCQSQVREVFVPFGPYRTLHRPAMQAPPRDNSSVTDTAKSVHMLQPGFGQQFSCKISQTRREIGSCPLRLLGLLERRLQPLHRQDFARRARIQTPNEWQFLATRMLVPPDVTIEVWYICRVYLHTRPPCRGDPHSSPQLGGHPNPYNPTASELLFSSVPTNSIYPCGLQTHKLRYLSAHMPPKLHPIPSILVHLMLRGPSSCNFRGISTPVGTELVTLGETLNLPELNPNLTIYLPTDDLSFQWAQTKRA